MCSISGFYNTTTSYTKEVNKYNHILDDMRTSMSHRGPDDEDTLLTDHCGLAHTRLSIIDLEGGHQPMSKISGGRPSCHIVYNGEVYNSDTLRQALSHRGVALSTTSDTELMLASYMSYGPDFIQMVDGIYALAIYDEWHDTLTLYRDPFGVKPLYYTMYQDTLIFASEIKGCLAYPGVEAVLDREGLCELIALGPAHNPGSGVLRGFYELLPGTYMTCNTYGRHVTTYYSLPSRPHTDSYEETIEHTSHLLVDAIERQMVSDVDVCTFLSGGVDSSVVSAVCARRLKKDGRRLTTFSFDFADNDKYFKANAFQPSRDRPYVDQMVSYLGSDHHYLVCDTQTQADLLYASVEAHDLPCMADIDSSLLYFCKEVSRTHKVVLTGECADEVFGGYPWFHREDMLDCGTFPWTPTIEPRKMLYNKALLDTLDLDSYVRESYRQAVCLVPSLPFEDEAETNRRRISSLNIRYFMQTLLDRMDRTSMASGLEARVPFADKALVEYVYNIPWEMKAKGGLVKNVLRQAAKGLLPEEILFRKKSPYPKTYHPGYERMLVERLRKRLCDDECPLLPLLDRKALERFLESPKDYGAPWYGQLMAGPQMIAYLLQIEYFLRKYSVRIEA